MKKMVWMLVLAAFTGFGLLQTVMAEDAAPAKAPKHERGPRPELKSFSGTVKVDGDKVTLATADGDLVLASRNPKALEELKAKAGQTVEVKGFVREKDGVKVLHVPGMRGPRGEGRGKHQGPKAEGAAPAAK